MEIIFIGIALLVFYYFAFWLMITGVVGAIRMYKSQHWKLTKGKILDAEIFFRKSGGGVDDETTFNFVVKHSYSYIVNGKKYESDQTLASDSLYQKEFKSMSEFPKRYGDLKGSISYLNAKKRHNDSIGKTVAVYYNPNKPEIACLENRFEKRIFLPMIMGLILSVVLTFISYKFLNHYLVNL